MVRLDTPRVKDDLVLLIRTDTDTDADTDIDTGNTKGGAEIGLCGRGSFTPYVETNRSM